ncbi:hypothetical protein PybrP1_005310, partial [[Pythium] brassicae (nom. inval.)]
MVAFGWRERADSLESAASTARDDDDNVSVCSEDAAFLDAHERDEGSAARDMAELRSHRHRHHRGVEFLDLFHAGCVCGASFASRAAATRHALACVQRALSPTPTPTDPERAHMDREHDASSDTTSAAHAAHAATDPPHQAPSQPESDGEAVAQHAASPVPRAAVPGRQRRAQVPSPDPRVDALEPQDEEVQASGNGGGTQDPLVVDIAEQQILQSQLAEIEHQQQQHVEERQDPEQQQQQQRARPAQVQQQQWTLRFDGACRRNPGAAGAGATLLDPSGVVTWTLAMFLPSATNTNNTAEYMALIGGLRGALHHGATRLLVEGDSRLVLAQVRGEFACQNPRLRRLRKKVRTLLRSLEQYQLRHIDRLANRQADRLANQGLDSRTTTTVCSAHGRNGAECVTLCPDLSQAPVSHTSGGGADADARATRGDGADHVEAMPDFDMDDDDEMDVEAEAARRTDGEVFPTFAIGPGCVPKRRRRLQLRRLTPEENEAANGAVAQVANTFADRLSDVETWKDGEGLVSALTAQLYSTLVPFCHRDSRPSARRGQNNGSQREDHARPPRVSSEPLESALSEALDDVAAAQSAPQPSRRAVNKARRRAGRVRNAMRRESTRKLFESNEKTCMQRILSQAAADGTDSSSPALPSRCPISRDELQRHFQGTNAPVREFEFDAPAGRSFVQLLDALPVVQHAAGAFEDEIGDEEVEDALQSANTRSAPGADGVGYDVLKRFGVELLPALHAAFAFCWRHGRIPSTWKVSTTQLIYKKGDPASPSSWRPICLQVCVYKLYASVLARRLSRWLDANERLTDAQKGFRHFNGCNEHAFVASAILDQTRRRPRELHMVWYDLRNAFGTIPPALLWRVMTKIGVPASFVSRCVNIYEDSYTTIANGVGGATDPIRHELGVYQGCPLSPTLFIVGVMPLVRALDGLRATGVQLAAEASVSVSAYADDVKTASCSADGIRQAHALVASFLSWSTMSANTTKCAALSVKPDLGRLREHPSPPVLEFDGEPIPRIGMSGSYSYLGVGDGFNHVRRRVSIVPTIAKLKRELAVIFRSQLAPWQMVRAVKTHVISQAEYLLRHVRPLHQQLQSFDSALARGVRTALRLPPVSLSAMLYSPQASGGLGFVKLTQLLSAAQIAHAFQMLHSPDTSVRAIARAQVVQIARTRFTLDAAHWRDRDDELVQLLLNSELAASPFATAKRSHGDVSSLWIDVQRHLRTLGLKLTTEQFTAPDGTVSTRALQLRVPHSTKVLQPKTVAKQLKQHMKLLALAEWKAASDQGRTVRAHGQVGSAFLTRGGGLSDAEFRFALHGRLNLVCTRAVLKRMKQLRTPVCRSTGCSHAETLPHVLNHCRNSKEVVRGRHDNVLALIRAKIESVVQRSQGRVTARFEEQVDGFVGAALRPDVQVFDREARVAVITDVAVAFDDQTGDDPSTSNLSYAYEYKVRKYAPLARHLEREGWTVKLSALAFGSLGSVAPRNFKILTEDIGLLKKDATKLLRAASTTARRLCLDLRTRADSITTTGSFFTAPQHALGTAHRDATRLETTGSDGRLAWDTVAATDTPAASATSVRAAEHAHTPSRAAEAARTDLAGAGLGDIAAELVGEVVAFGRRA